MATSERDLARVYNPEMETPSDDMIYEPVPQTEFERMLNALRAIIVVSEEIRREAPSLVIE